MHGLVARTAPFSTVAEHNAENKRPKTQSYRVNFKHFLLIFASFHHHEWKERHEKPYNGP